MVDDDHLVGQLVGLVQVLRRQQHVGARPDERPDGVPQLDAAARVEPGGRLVEEQQPRRTDEAGAEVEPAAHAARVAAHEAVGGLGQPDLTEHGLGGGPRRPSVVAEQAGDHHQVLPPAERRLDGCRLPGQPDRPPHPLGMRRGVDAGDAQLAGVGSDQRGDGTDERRLAGSVGSEHGGHRAGRSDEVEAVEGHDLSERLAQAGGLDRVVGHGTSMRDEVVT